MIKLDNISLARGARMLLEDVSLMIHDRQRVGIIGANGCGKSTLFAMLRGELHAERGTLTLPNHTVMAHVKQETPSVPDSALNYVLDGDHELRAIEKEIAALQHATSDDPENGARLADLHHRFEAIDGYSARARAGALLAGLGFAHNEHERPVNTFSGGWRMRLNLAQALMCRSTMLLLDEPTNHLDLDAVLWLEDWLRRYPGTLLLITHDRDFLDNVVNLIVHFDHGSLKAYKGNYAQFERERAAQLANQQASFEKQERAIAHLQSFIDRFRAKATKARQVQSRLKQLERMPKISAAHVDNPFSFAFAPNDSHARQLVLLEKASVGYQIRESESKGSSEQASDRMKSEAPGAQEPECTGVVHEDSEHRATKLFADMGTCAELPKVILQQVNCSILSDARIGLLGQNGAGKSTLIRTITGHLPLLAGVCHIARDLRIGYFAQHQLDTLDPEASALQHLQRLDPLVREQNLRDFLGGFAFHGDQATQAVATFSGGERARLALALIVYQRPQMLILDEPTNHLDIEMREALIEALQAFDGALLVVAHDRYLLSATVDTFWLIRAGQLTPFDGDLDDYRQLVLARAKDEAGNDTATPAAVPDRKTQKRLEAEARQRRAPLVKRQAEIEEQLTVLTRDRDNVEQWLASPAAYDETAKTQLSAALTRQRELAKQIAELEEAWMKLEEQL